MLPLEVDDRLGVLLALSAAFFFGLGNVYTSRGNYPGGINIHEGLLLSLIVNNLINVLLIPVIVIFTTIPDFNWLGITSYVGAGFFSSFLGRILLFSGILYIGASLTGSFKITAPLFTIVIAYFALQERLSLVHMMGISVILVGVAIVMRETQTSMNRDTVYQGSELPVNDSPRPEFDCLLCSQDKKTIRLGIIVALLTGLSLGIGSVMRKMGVMYYPNPLVGGMINSFASLVFLILLVHFNPLRSSVPVEVEFRSILKRRGSREYVLLGFMTSCAMYSLYFSLSFLEVSIVNTIASIEALFTILIASIMLKSKEAVTGGLILGAVIIIAGICIITMY